MYEADGFVFVAAGSVDADLAVDLLNRVDARAGEPTARELLAVLRKRGIELTYDEDLEQWLLLRDAEGGDSGHADDDGEVLRLLLDDN